MIIEVNSSDEMIELGARLGGFVRGSEVLVLIGDIGAGKTTFTKGFAKAMGVLDDVQSPTFTISRVYETSHDITLAHYDFYRLSDPGIMRDELAESTHDSNVVTVIEWAEVVADVLPADTLSIVMTATGESRRKVVLTAGGDKTNKLIEGLK